MTPTSGSTARARGPRLAIMPTTVVAMLLVLGCSASDPRPAERPSLPPVALPASAGQACNGLRLELQQPAERRYALGDPIDLPLSFRNIGAASTSILIDECCSFYDHVHVIDDHGRECAASQDRARLAHVGPRWVDLPPGGVRASHQYLAAWVVIDHPGTYVVWYEFAMGRRELALLPHAIPAFNPRSAPWQGALVSNPVTITILPPDEHARRAGVPLREGDRAGLPTFGLVHDRVDIGDAAGRRAPPAQRQHAADRGSLVTLWHGTSAEPSDRIVRTSIRGL